MTNEEKMKIRAFMIWAIINIATVLFWGIWFLINGSVPEITSIVTERWTIPLPFGVSRFWDMLILVPIYSCLMSYFFDKKISTKDLDVKTGFGAIVGIICGVFAAIFWGIPLGLIALCLGFVLWTALVIQVGLGLYWASIAGLVLGLILGMIYNLFFIFGFLFLFSFFFLFRIFFFGYPSSAFSSKIKD